MLSIDSYLFKTNEEYRRSRINYVKQQFGSSPTTNLPSYEIKMLIYDYLLGSIKRYTQVNDDYLVVIDNTARNILQSFGVPIVQADNRKKSQSKIIGG